MRTSVAFRVSDSTAILLDGLRATFPDQSWRPTFEWLLSQPAVLEVISARVRAEQLGGGEADSTAQRGVALDAPVLT
jgi:hypothetical protein